jgi:hypothetical protein
MTLAPAPSKAKSWVALAGSLLAVAVPLAAQVATHLPPQWSAIIGGLIALLTMFGVYHAPYVPPGAVVVAPPPGPRQPPAGGYTNPWR